MWAQGIQIFQVGGLLLFSQSGIDVPQGFGVDDRADYSIV